MILSALDAQSIASKDHPEMEKERDKKKDRHYERLLQENAENKEYFKRFKIADSYWGRKENALPCSLEKPAKASRNDSDYDPEKEGGNSRTYLAVAWKRDNPSYMAMIKTIMRREYANMPPPSAKYRGEKDERPEDYHSKIKMAYRA